jgi:hypothetical protein
MKNNPVLVQDKKYKTTPAPLVFSWGDNIYIWLMVWNMNFMTFHSVGNGIIIPTAEFHHFSEGWLNHQPVKLKNGGCFCWIDLKTDEKWLNAGNYKWNDLWGFIMIYPNNYGWCSGNKCCEWDLTKGYAHASKIGIRLSTHGDTIGCNGHITKD